MGWDPIENELELFGGAGVKTTHKVVWETTWLWNAQSGYRQPTGTPARAYAATAFDPVTGVDVLYGDSGHRLLRDNVDVERRRLAQGGIGRAPRRNCGHRLRPSHPEDHGVRGRGATKRDHRDNVAMGPARPATTWSVRTGACSSSTPRTDDRFLRFTACAARRAQPAGDRHGVDRL